MVKIQIPLSPCQSPLRNQWRQTDIWLREMAHLPGAPSNTQMPVEALGWHRTTSQYFTQNLITAFLSPNSLAFVGPSSMKIRLKIVPSHCVAIKTNTFLLYTKTFSLTQNSFFSPEFKRNANVFVSPLKQWGPWACPHHTSPHPAWWLSPCWPPSSRPLASHVLWGHSPLFLAVAFQFPELITDHAYVTYQIKKENLLFLLYDVREFSTL